jgi:hypothetical protein
MRRALILLTLALAGGLLASCGKGGQASTSANASTSAPKTGSSSAPGAPSTGAAPSTQRALAFARAVNLTPADVPGFTASEKHPHNSPREKQLEGAMLRCAGVAGASKGVVEQSSKAFELKRSIIDFSVSSEVNVQPSARQASSALAAIRSAHVRGCFSRFIEQSFRGQRASGATIGPVSIQSGTPPAPGTTGGFGLRVTATFHVRSVKVPVYLDFLGFVDGPSEVTLLSSGLLRPFPATVQQHLFALLLSRAKAHRL